MHRPGLKIALPLLLSLMLAGWYLPARAQEATGAPRPIDMMILVDNSCSMFPANQILPGCDSYGSDPNFLRIIGADLFIARLGFASADEANYQLGVIGIGDAPQMISHLQPLAGNRDSLAAQIANPKAQPATKIIPALQMAYTELKSSPNRKADNLPAAVLITDGIPWPREGQTNADIEQLIQRNPETPLFVIVLQDPNQTNPDFEGYIRFWKDMQSRYSFVSVYLITSADQIQETYNQILGQLQNTIPTKGVTVDEGSELKFTVGAYNQRVLVTIIRKPGSNTGTATIFDPNGDPVEKEQDGVVYFRGKENPIEVYSIVAPRLAPELKDKTWTVKTSEAMTVLINREGTYRFNFLTPAVTPGDLTNQYQAVEQQSRNQGFKLRFSLVDETGAPVREKQPLWGVVTAPDGKTANLAGIDTTQPQPDGAYEVTIDVNSLFGAGGGAGRYIFDFTAGKVDEQDPNSPPISTARLFADLAIIPVLRSIAPAPIQCLAGQPVNIRVTVGDLPSEHEAGASVQVISGSQSVMLQPKGSGVFSGDLGPLCQAQYALSSCGTEQTTTFTVQLDVPGVEGLPSIKKELAAGFSSPACTPTPVPTATATPTPTPTPVPDTDRDGINNLADKCPELYGLNFSQGCPPWNLLYGGAAGLVFLAFVGLWVWPWAQVRWITPPPVAYLAPWKDGKPLTDPIDIHKVGRAKSTRHITIGGRKHRANIFVDGLEPVEFIVEWQGTLVSLRDRKEKEPFAFFDKELQIIRTSDPKVTLRISLNPDLVKE